MLKKLKEKMLRSFLRFYFKSKQKRVFSYICFPLIIAFVIARVEIRIDIHPFIYITVIISFIASLFLYLEVKEKRICTISDTKLNQKKYYDETSLEAFSKKKLKVGYRKWLILTMIENDHDIGKTNSFFVDFGNDCLYCYFGITLITIVSVLFLIYITLTQTLLIIFVLVISFITICIIADKRTRNLWYKQIDSEIKRILFEEETGYSPLVKGKYTFKYKAWLTSCDEKIQTAPYRN